MRWLGLTIVAMMGFAGQAGAQSAESVQVMVLGTYHFDSPGLDINNPKVDDVLKPTRQKEIEALADALAQFRPTRIMVERIAKTPDLLDQGYAAFRSSQLRTKRDERVQLAYRLARRLGHRAVFAIDEQMDEGEPDYFPFGKVVAWTEANGKKAELDALMAQGASRSARIEQLQKEGTIGHALLEMNRPEWTLEEQALYYGMLSLGDTDRQPGADLNAMWYLRNAKIFAKLHKVVSPGDRVPVIYGAGHNYWLRHFASTVAGFRNVDPVPYLEKAARPAR
jgi:hypothetical protein